MARSFSYMRGLAAALAAPVSVPAHSTEPPQLSAYGELASLEEAAISPRGQPSAAAPAQDSGQQGEEESLTFPFSPPMEMPLHFRVTKSEVGEHKQPNRVYDEELTYHATAGGYLLTIKTLSISVPGHVIRTQEAASAILPMPDIIDLASPITLRLGPTGRTIVVDDWDTLRDSIQLLPERLTRSAPVTIQARVLEAATNAIQPIIHVDGVGAWNFVAAEWPPMLGYGGVQFPLNEALATSSVHYLFDGAVPVKLNHEVRVRRRAAGGFALDETQRPDRTDFARAVSQFYDQLAKSMSPETLAARRAIDADLQKDLVRTATTHVETDGAGAFQSGYWEVTYKHADGTVAAGERVSFENLGTAALAGASN